MPISGIYSIRNISNNKRYIGSSINIYERWTVHRRFLRTGNHDNMHLQNSWIKYGEDFFIFEVLEDNIPKEFLELRENEYITKFKIANIEKNVFDSTKGFNTQWAGKTGCVDPNKIKKGKDHFLYGKPNWRKGTSNKELFGKDRAEQISKVISESKKGIISSKKYKHKLTWNEMSYNRQYKLWKNNDPLVPEGWLPARMRRNA